MQHKWKGILVNWLNCYFNESDNKEKSVSVESVLIIISYLRDNLNLDQSKSSLLEANNIEEFLAEKYPDFKFDSGTLEPSNEEEIYVVASLLLFFVCVNSKDVDIKNAMCSKLSAGDQEVILKFSKCLMDCPGISYKDVLVAITESCGQDIAVMDGEPPAASVAETPPALRSLHGEVRRLQASLDAERFDRNYLQEELARTNLKLEKLLKDKEQSKLEVMSLKGKISLCCGQEKDMEGSANSQGLDAGRLSKQLQEAEERLGDLQAQIEELQYERDTYKSKMEQLKEERDKWLMLSQHEGARAQKLSEDLELERNQNQSLKDLVQELRQHNRLNGLDASLLECDDPDASLSLHNVSVCSEACANVIEVQLGEEKAKVVALKQQIQSLLDQLDSLRQKANDEKKHYENILLEKENDVFELKHRINEEIEEKSNMKIIHGEEIMKLNNEINELEQKLKENVENTRDVIEKKIQEIQMLQEEKLSLLQSLSDETTKMDNIIKNLKAELAAELSSKSKMKDDYENKLMKLNEKVLNRNNELVELQNNVFEKSEMIETMRIELKKEKTVKEELCNKHNHEIITLNEKRTTLENLLEEKSDEMEKILQELNLRNSLITELKNKNEEAMSAIATLEDDCRILKESQEKLKVEVKNRDAKINQIETKFYNEKQQLEHDIDEKNATLNTLQMQLQAEIQFKLEIQHSMSELQKLKTNLSNEIEKLKNGLSTAQTELHDKEKMIHGLDLYLKEEKLTNEKLKRESKRLSDALLGKEREITKLNNKRKEEVKTWVDKLKHNRDDLTHVKNECETLSKKLQDCSLEHEKTNNEIISILNTGLDKIIKNLKSEEVCNEVLQKYINNNDGLSIYKKCDQLINIANILTTELSLRKNLERQLQHENSAVSELKAMIKDKEMQIDNLHSKLEEAQQTFIDAKSDLTKQAEIYNSALELKSRDIQKLQNENSALSIEISDAKVQLEEKVHSLQEKIMDNEKLTDKLKKSYECQIENLNIMIAKLTHYLKDKTTELNIVKKEYEKLSLTVEENKTEIKSLSDEIKALKQNEEKIITDFESERLVLKNMVTVTESVMEDQKNSQNKIINDLTKANEVLKDENNNLKSSISDINKIAYEKLEEKESILIAAIKELAEVKELNKALERKIELDNEKSEKVLKNTTVALEEKKQTLEMLEKQIDKLLMNKEDSEKAISVMEDENNKLVQAIEVLKDENKTLITSLSDENKIAYDKLEENESILKAAIKELEELKELNKALERQIEIDNERTEKEFNVSKIALAEKKQMLEKMEKQIDELSKIREDNVKAISTLEDESNKLVQAIEVLKDENKNLKTSLSDENKIAYEKLEKKATVLNAAIKELAEVKELNKALERKMELNNEKAEKQLKDLTVALEERKQMLKKVEKQIEELLKKKESNEKAISVLEDENNNLVQDKMNLENKFQSQIDSVTKALNDVTLKYKDIEQSLNIEVKEKTAALDKIKSLQENIDMMVRDKNEIEQIKIDLENKIKNLMNTKEKETLEEKKYVEKIQAENEYLVKIVEENKLAISCLEEENNKLVQAVEVLKDENNNLKTSLSDENKIAYEKLEEKELIINAAIKELAEIKELNKALERKIEFNKKTEKELKDSTVALEEKKQLLENIEKQNDELLKKKQDNEKAISILEDDKKNLVHEKLNLENKLQSQIESVTNAFNDVTLKYKDIEQSLNIEVKEKTTALDKIKSLQENIDMMVRDKNEIEQIKIDLENKIKNLMNTKEKETLEEKKYVEKIQAENEYLVKIVEENKLVIINQEQLIRHELEENKKLREDFNVEKLSLTNQCALLREYQTKAEKVLLEREKEIAISREEIKTLKNKVDSYEAELNEKATKIAELNVEKDTLISSISKQLIEEKCLKETYQKEMEAKTTDLYDLRQKLEEYKTDSEMLNALKKENEELIKAIGQRDTFAVTSHGKLSSLKASGQGDKDLRPNQVDITPTDMTHSSNESFKTITDLEKIIHDKNRTITTLQSDITYMKSLMAESENKLLDVTKELELNKENCQQLGIQLKKIVHAKNEEIADLKKHLNKMSATENRASQIIKVSAKYQAIILKRIAEIKSNTILKELTNYGNSNSYDSELKRSLNTGAITMEDLENFLETTDKHLRRCSEKQLALQKERDRLTEVNRINESEIINLKKFLTELSVSFKTFNSVKDLYGQKLSRVVLLQRSVRREILNMEGHLSDTIMYKLERGYAAVMQDMYECAMNLERWVERCISRTVSAEKIKQAFTSDLDRASLSTNSFQNPSIEVQLEELENSFQKLLEEVARAQKSGSSRDPKEVTVMEVRAEYEDKLNRMKSKMKQLYQEQIAIFKEKQREDLAALERELLKTRQRLSDSSRGYEEHIRELTNELWNVGEKFLMEKDEAAWLRKKQRTGSLMSLQHVHSSGLVAPPQLPSRPSDAHSLRSLQVNLQGTKKTDGELHMSDEEGEVFDNRWLKSLASPGAGGTGGAGGGGPGRLSELQWRNSLCPPHLKSSYPAETQFQPTIDEENIKFQAGVTSLGGRQQRKEVGITAYKKPGPPTPSKQAGRLSATDSELRESLRPDPDVQVSRKTSTPSRLRSLFRSDKRSDTVEGTPRSRRISNIFRKNRRE